MLLKRKLLYGDLPGIKTCLPPLFCFLILNSVSCNPIIVSADGGVADGGSDGGNISDSGLSDGGDYDSGMDGGLTDGGIDGGTDAGIDAGNPDSGFDPGYCLTSQCFPVPPTGQTMCYDNSGLLYGDGGCPSLSDRDAGFWGQDAMFLKARTFNCFDDLKTSKACSGSNLEDGDTVADSLTGLMWQRKIDSSVMDWDQAVDYCTNVLNLQQYGGYSDWRLPNPFEFTSIVDRQNPDPSIDLSVFPGTPSDFFWTSLADPLAEPYAWSMHFKGGSLSIVHKYNFIINVRCVRMGPQNTVMSSAKRFITTTGPDGRKLVSDSVTGLMWQYEYEHDDVTWAKALSYCAHMNYGGYFDWRLPNINELESLVNYKMFRPASDFPGMAPYHFLSSTTVVSWSSHMWDVFFDSGDILIYGKSVDGDSVRCVRQGP